MRQTSSILFPIIPLLITNLDGIGGVKILHYEIFLTYRKKQEYSEFTASTTCSLEIFTGKSLSSFPWLHSFRSPPGVATRTSPPPRVIPRQGLRFITCPHTQLLFLFSLTVCIRLCKLLQLAGAQDCQMTHPGAGSLTFTAV